MVPQSATRAVFVAQGFGVVEDIVLQIDMLGLLEPHCLLGTLLDSVIVYGLVIRTQCERSALVATTSQLINIIVRLR